MCVYVCMCVCVCVHSHLTDVQDGTLDEGSIQFAQLQRESSSKQMEGSESVERREREELVRELGTCT